MKTLRKSTDEDPWNTALPQGRNMLLEENAQCCKRLYDWYCDATVSSPQSILANK